MTFLPASRALYRSLILLISLITLCHLYNGATHLIESPTGRLLSDVVLGTHYGPKKNVFENLGMGEQDCRATFPGLFKEIDDSVARGPFQLERARNGYTGLVQGRIEHGKVCISIHILIPLLYNKH